MKGFFKKTLSMVLCFVMVFTMFQGSMLSASAKVVGPDNKTELTITTDKSKYSWGDTVVFNITVKNVTDEVLTGIKVNSFARAYIKVVQQGDLPVIARLAPGESETVQIEYYTTKLVGFVAIFFPIIWLFNPVARIAYREAHFNYESKVKVGLFRYKVGFEVKYNESVDNWEDILGFGNDIDLTDENNNNIPDSIEQITSIDSDSDYLPDYMEKILGTNPKVKDTDFDGLPDGYEVTILGSDATLPDTNGDSILDGDEDPDSDGLTNAEEYAKKTHPLLYDTDDDTLSDKDEISKYHTDPVNADTDNDGLRDNDELIYGMNPLFPDSKNDGILDGDRIFDVVKCGGASDNSLISASIDVSIDGKNISGLDIEKIGNNDVFLNTDVPGYLGNAYELSTEEPFDSATLSFDLDDSLFHNPDFNPSIFFWNSEEKTLEEIENQSLSGHTISADLEHFSSYIVLDKSLYEASVFEYEIEAPTSEEMQNKKFDIYFVLDESGSISYSDYSLMRTKCSELIDCLAEDDRVGIITFDGTVRSIIGLSDKTTAKKTMANLSQHDGMTALYSAVNKAANSFEEDSDSTRIIIALTDGKDNESSISYSTATNNAKANRAVLYTIGVGSSVSANILRTMAENTGGQYYPVSSFSNLSSVFERIISDADLYKDSDEDGISDYHEKCIANGKLRIGTGATLSNFVSMNYLSADSDSDELSDFEEIEISERVVSGKTVYYCKVFSNPCLQDSDSDKLNDVVEVYAGFNPLVDDSGSTSVSGSTFSTNTYREWLEMVEENSWNFIHNAVEVDVRTKTPGMSPTELWLKSSTGKLSKRVDLWYPATGEIWDVKPASYKFNPQKTASGIAQLAGYVALGPINGYSLCIGGPLVRDSSFSIGNYNIEYQNMQNGLITYHFKNTVSPPIVVPEYETQPEERPVTETQWYEWLWEGAKSVGYSVQAFGDMLLDAISSLGQAIVDHAEEIIATGVAIGGIIGIAYIIVNMLPLLAVAAV